MTILNVDEEIEGDIVNPSTIAGYPVTKIDDFAFTGCKNIKSITIPDGVTSIGYGAFDDCTSLKDVYYSKTESEWNAISIYDYNECLTEANIHFISNGIVRFPSQTEIYYGDSIILHAYETKIPAGGYVKWTADNDNFILVVSDDGKTCEITPQYDGETIITVTVYDKDGNIVNSDTQKMISM